MPQNLASYNVFIASPGGLEQERKVFRTVLEAYNSSDAHARNCHFEPIGWEITLGGVGRPQSKINEDLKRCDYMFLVLWDRWGSPTAKNGKFSSGTEEEFRIAQECHVDPNSPMQNIVVLFKAVDPRQLSDPGDQLNKVLEFKKGLERSRELHFETFDTIESFSEKIRRHLADWKRNHESGISGTKNSEITKRRNPSISIEKFASRDTKEETYTRRIESAYRKGNLTETEASLVKKVVTHKNIPAFYEYGLFLMKSNRLSDALDIFGEMHRLAYEMDSFSWAGSAMARMGGIYRIQQRYTESEDALVQSIALKRKANDQKGEMSAHIWYGDLLWKLGRTKASHESYSKASRLCDSAGNEKIKADIDFKIAKCLIKLDQGNDAVTHAENALSTYQKLKLKQCIQSVKQWRKGNRSKIGKS